MGNEDEDVKWQNSQINFGFARDPPIPFLSSSHTGAAIDGWLLPSLM